MSAPSEAKLFLCINNRSKLALSILLDECTRFAIRPLKWLRFLGFAIYGREGYLSTSKNGPELDYTAEIGAHSYYYVSDGRPRFIDVDALDNRTSMASDLSNGRVNFRNSLIERDGGCVMTGDLTQNCIACHFIPHAKGDNYMSNLFNYRREAYDLTGMDLLDNINDPRNGILLSCGFHGQLDACHIAFLKTPNFALTIDDIPYHHAPPNAPANRFTLQYIQPHQIGPLIPLYCPHNSDARQPGNIDLWPPAIIVDLCYAVAVLRAWGPQSFITYARKNSWDAYYQEGGGTEASAAATGQLPTQPSARTIRYDTRNANKAQAVESAGQQSSADMFDVVMALWTMSAREAAREGRLSGASDNESKIRRWLRSVEDDGADMQEGTSEVAEHGFSPGGGNAPSSFPYHSPGAH